MTEIEIFQRWWNFFHIFKFIVRTLNEIYFQFFNKKKPPVFNCPWKCFDLILIFPTKKAILLLSEENPTPCFSFGSSLCSKCKNYWNIIKCVEKLWKFRTIYSFNDSLRIMCWKYRENCFKIYENFFTKFVYIL